MRSDKFGQIILNEWDLCGLYLQNPERKVSGALVESGIKLSTELEFQNPPALIEYIDSIESIEEFDTRLQSNWHMPDEYKNLDIAEWLLGQCSTDAELQRIGEELLLYLERDLFPLLRYLKYLVDTMRQHNIVWGVGRGSSVASYALYLIGVHRINSLYYDLDISEFLR